MVKPNPPAQCRSALTALLDVLERDPLLRFAPGHARAGERVFARAYGVALPNITRALFEAVGLDQARLPYVGLTRAAERLLLAFHGQSEITRRLAAAIPLA